MSYFISSRTIIYSSPKREGEKPKDFLGVSHGFRGGGGVNGGGTVVATRVWEGSLKKNDGGRRGEGGFIRMLQGLWRDQINFKIKQTKPSNHLTSPPRPFSLSRNYHKLVFEYGYFNAGSISVSGQLPTYPSPNPTLTLTCHQLTVVGLGEG